MTTSVSTVDETMPPIIGTAIRCMTSEPVPVLTRSAPTPRQTANLEGRRARALCPGRSRDQGLAARPRLGLCPRLEGGIHGLEAFLRGLQHAPPLERPDEQPRECFTLREVRCRI